ncbi:MAG: anthranilate synthase component I, partial [Candidatus Omnitrophica bacterium]|nr:anthranilate synthase component I [Candidatus Omnitrophota bacterium]
MYYPSLKEFLELSRKGNVIPVYKEINADLDTPVSAYLKMEKSDFSFLLESVEGQEKIARYSFLGANPSLVFKSKGKNIQILFPHIAKTRRFVTQATPLEEIKKIMQRYRSVNIAGLPRFYGGLVGYIGYDTVRFFERIPDKNPDDLGLADSLFILTDTILIFDHVNHTIKIVKNVILPQAKNKISAAKLKKIYNQAINKIESIQKDFYKPFHEKGKKAAVRGKNIKLSS